LHLAASVFALVSFAPVSAYALVKCAVLAAETNVNDTNDIQSKLMGTGQFSSVTVVNIHTSTPTLADLKTYGSVLVFSDNTIYDAGSLGDRLADYVDGGGGVVVAVFAIGDLQIGGRFASDDYYAIEPGAGTNTFTSASLGTVYHSDSPVMTGVTTFAGGSTPSRISSATINANAVRVADWSDGLPLVATRVLNGTNRVDLNFFPPSGDAGTGGWVSSTNGAQILANALVLAASPVAEIQTPAPEVTVPPTVAIRGKKRTATTKTVYVVKGTASATTTSVVLTIGKVKRLRVAKGTVNWTFRAHLKPGANKIVAEAIDGSGQKSVPAKITVILQ
jgi:hypothetical protein